MEKENQRIAISKRLLKEALLRLLKEKDLSKVSITELCHEAGINRATFYRHYNVPQDVLVDIEKELIDKAQNIAPLPATTKGIMPYLEKLFTFIYDNAELARILIRSNTETHLIELFDVRSFAILEAKVSAKDAFLFDKTNLKLLSAFLGGGGYYLVRAWLMDDISRTPKEIAQFSYELLNQNLNSYIVGLNPYDK